MDNNSLKKLIGSRIQSEANDLKRTPQSLSEEIGISEDVVNKVIKGDCGLEESYEVIRRMGSIYPIDISDLYIQQDDCINGIRIMGSDESKKSSRTFKRKDRNGNRTPYYEYRDTAMSRHGPFKPEWIKELRIVDDSDANNPDVAYNNGHFLHQMTFFIGPVNFYWEVNGERFSSEMNKGDSNYITPFWPHSFTSRDENKEALIIAVTFGGDVRRALKEFYSLTEDEIKRYILDYRNHNRAVTQLIRQHMDNENMSFETLKTKAKLFNIDLDLERILDSNEKKTIEDLEKLARLLSIQPSDMMVPNYSPTEEVVVKKRSEKESYFFPNEKTRLYRVNQLARTSKMSLMKGFDIEVLQSQPNLEYPFNTNLHTYAYNYGDKPTRFLWEREGKSFEDVLHPGDSIYVKPNIPHLFVNHGKDSANLCLMRVSGGVNIATQRELSYFSDFKRVTETKKWFD